MNPYREAWQLDPGDVILSAGKCPALVIENREPTHGAAAAYGLRAIVVDLLTTRGDRIRTTLPLMPSDRRLTVAGPDWPLWLWDPEPEEAQP